MLPPSQMLATKKPVPSLSVWILTLLGMTLFAGCAPPGPRALLQGERLIRKGDYELAIDRLEEATRLLPKSAQGWNHLGLAYHGASRFDGAIKAYQQALALDRNLASPYYNLGCLHLEQSNLPAAMAALTSYTGLQPTAPAGWVKLGTAQLRARQFDAAEKSFSHALKLNAHQPEAINGLGVLQFHRRRYPDAFRQFSAALREQPDYAPALLNCAVVCHHYLTNRTVALQKYREFLALRPTPPNASAVEPVARQLELELRPPSRPSTTSTPLQLATVTNQPLPPAQGTNKTGPSLAADKPVAAPATSPPTGSPPAARLAAITSAPPAYFPAATSIPPTRTEISPPPPAKVEVVQVTNDEPIRPARDVVGNAPPPTSNTTAAPIKPNGNVASPDAAAAANERAGFAQRLNPRNWFRSKDKTTDPSSPPATESQADRAERVLARSSQPGAGRPAAARYTYHSLASPQTGNRTEAERLLSQGVQAQERNRLNEAIDAYRMAAKADPSFFDAHYNLGVAAYEAGELTQTLLAYEYALAVNPVSLKARFNFAIALQKANYPLDAASELEKMVANHPDEARAHFTLANLYAQQLGLPQKAREHYRRVLELEPQHSQATAIRFWLEANP